MRAIAWICLLCATPAVAAPEIVTGWKTFTTADGLPGDKVFAVLASGGEVWAGTTNGLARLRDGRWTTYGTADGLAHRVVLSLAKSKVTGDVWIGTMGGLSRFSAGRIDTFTQISSGLANDVVYGVGVHGEDVWAATAAGLSRYNTRTGAWTIFNETNTPMQERWCYNVCTTDKKVYVAVWGGGILEYDLATRTWLDYRDPDKEMELDLYRDDGLVHDVTSSVDVRDGVMWVSTYFGMSRYDGRHWRGYQDNDGGLPSNFVNFVRASGKGVWVATDKGVARLEDKTWVIYTRAKAAPGKATPGENVGGEIRIVRGGEEQDRRETASPIADNYVLAVDVDGDDVWLATAHGLSRSER